MLACPSNTRNLRLKGRKMQLPLMLHPESLPRVLQGIAIGVVATVLVGFSAGGWVTGSRARTMAQQESNDALIAALAPVCVQNFQNSPRAPENLVELNNFTVIWDRGAFIEKGGWAMMPVTTIPVRYIAQESANILGRTRSDVVR